MGSWGVPLRNYLLGAHPQYLRNFSFYLKYFLWHFLVALRPLTPPPPTLGSIPHGSILFFSGLNLRKHQIISRNELSIEYIFEARVIWWSSFIRVIIVLVKKETVSCNKKSKIDFLLVSRSTPNKNGEGTISTIVYGCLVLVKIGKIFVIKLLHLCIQCRPCV